MAREGFSVATQERCSRLDSGDVGAACAWNSDGEWVWRGFYLGSNKEVFDAETVAIYQALKILDRQRTTGQQYTIFSDSQAAIQRIRTDSVGPGQQWARAALEVYARLAARDNEVTIRWVPAHSGVVGNEMVDGFAKEAASSQRHRAPGPGRAIAGGQPLISRPGGNR